MANPEIPPELPKHPENSPHVTYTPQNRSGAGQTTENHHELASLIHVELCINAERCGRWNNPKSSHQQHYLDRAYAIYNQLEPEIGSANVTLAVEVILGELS